MPFPAGKPTRAKIIPLFPQHLVFQELLQTIAAKLGKGLLGE